MRQSSNAQRFATLWANCTGNQPWTDVWATKHIVSTIDVIDDWQAKDFPIVVVQPSYDTPRNNWRTLQPLRLPDMRSASKQTVVFPSLGRSVKNTIIPSRYLKNVDPDLDDTWLTFRDTDDPIVTLRPQPHAKDIGQFVVVRPSEPLMNNWLKMAEAYMQDYPFLITIVLVTPLQTLIVTRDQPLARMPCLSGTLAAAKEQLTREGFVLDVLPSRRLRRKKYLSLYAPQRTFFDHDENHDVSVENKLLFSAKPSFAAQLVPDTHSIAPLVKTKQDLIERLASFLAHDATLWLSGTTLGLQLRKGQDFQVDETVDDHMLDDLLFLLNHTDTDLIHNERLLRTGIKLQKMGLLFELFHFS